MPHRPITDSTPGAIIASEKSHYTAPRLFAGTAGWSISKANSEFFPPVGTHLRRYAACLNAVEINSSFKNHHKPATYYRWATNVPHDFRFSVKLSHDITHKKLLQVSANDLKEIFTPMKELGHKLGVLLVQLPPTLQFQPALVEDFFMHWRMLTDIPIVCEPRHPSWLSTEALRIFQNYHISKVQADPDPCADQSGLFKNSGLLVYNRVHGSPLIYKSEYKDPFLQSLATQTCEEIRQLKNTWVIFDNTAQGFAIPNVMRFLSLGKAKAIAS